MWLCVCCELIRLKSGWRKAGWECNCVCVVVKLYFTLQWSLRIPTNPKKRMHEIVLNLLTAHTRRAEFARLSATDPLKVDSNEK